MRETIYQAQMRDRGLAPGLPREIRIPDRYNVKLYTDDDKAWAAEIRKKVSHRTERTEVVL